MSVTHPDEATLLRSIAGDLPDRVAGRPEEAPCALPHVPCRTRPHEAPAPTSCGRGRLARLRTRMIHFRKDRSRAKRRLPRERGVDGDGGRSRAASRTRRDRSCELLSRRTPRRQQHELDLADAAVRLAAAHTPRRGGRVRSLRRASRPSPQCWRKHGPSGEGEVRGRSARRSARGPQPAGHRQLAPLLWARLGGDRRICRGLGGAGPIRRARASWSPGLEVGESLRRSYRGKPS